MSSYDDPIQIQIPSPPVLFGVVAAWWTFISFAGAISLASATNSGNLVAGLLIAVGGAIVAVVSFALAVRTRRPDQTDVPLELRRPIRLLPSSPKRLDRAA